MDNIAEPSRVPHSRIEDALAMVLGTLMVSFGVIMLKQAGALTGSTAGIAFLISYLSPLSFGSAFFLINIPFLLAGGKTHGLGIYAENLLRRRSGVAVHPAAPPVRPLF